MSFADRLKARRKEKGYSQEQLAEILEVSRQSITKWETGTAYPELRKLIMLASTLDTDLDWLLMDERMECTDDGEGLTDDAYADAPIHDARSLERAMQARMTKRILGVLEGAEFSEDAKEAAFRGKRTYVVFGEKMYKILDGIDPTTGEEKKQFTQVEPDIVLDILAWLFRRNEEERDE